MTTIPAGPPSLTTLMPAHLPALHFVNEKAGRARPRPADYAGHYRYWDPNALQTLWVLSVDLDHADSLDHLADAIGRGLPFPSVLMEKTANGHAQAHWFIDPVATGPRSRQKPQEYAHAVRAALTQATGGDPFFSNHRSWNPWGTCWRAEARVIWGPTEARTLGKLADELKQAGMWPRSRPRPRPSTPSGISITGTEGRNCHVFTVSRLRTSGTVREVAEATNAALPDPLGQDELEGIIASIEAYEARTGRQGRMGHMTAEAREAHRQMSARGGAAGTAAQKAARAKGPAAASVTRAARAVGRAAEIRGLYEGGYSRQQIAERLGVSASTVKRALRPQTTPDPVRPTPASVPA